MREILSLIDLFVAALPKDLKSRVVIFGSSAIAINGVKLGRPIDDLDIFVSGDTFDQLSHLFSKKKKSGKAGEDVDYLLPFEKVEILNSFPGVNFDDVFRRAKLMNGSGGLLVGSLVDPKIWKMAQGRTKDVADLGAIAEFERSQTL